MFLVKLKNKSVILVDADSYEEAFIDVTFENTVRIFIISSKTVGTTQSHTFTEMEKQGRQYMILKDRVDSVIEVPTLNAIGISNMIMNAFANFTKYVDNVDKQ